MTISIPSTSAALAALEAMTNQQGAAAAGTSTASVGAIPQALLDPTSDSASDSGDILDLSGGSATASLGGLTGGLSTAASITDAAASAGSSIESLLAQMQQAAQVASDPTLTSDQRSQLNNGFQASLAQIQQAIAGASVDGVNLLDGSAVGQDNAMPATLSAYNLSLGGPEIGIPAGASLSDPSTASALAAQLGDALSNVTQAVGQIAADGQAIQGHLSVVSQAMGALDPGSASTISSSLDGDGARLAALQVQQTLSGTGSAISNQSPQAILALFAA